MSVYFTLEGAQKEIERPTYCVKCGARCNKTLKKTGEHHDSDNGTLQGEFHVVVRCPQHRGWLGPFSSHTASEKPSQGNPFS